MIESTFKASKCYIRTAKLCLLLILGLCSGFLKAQVIYNAYGSVTGISAKVLTIANPNETNHTFVVGENLIIMQMQDDVIGTNTTNVSTFGVISPTTNIKSAGLWEVCKISAVTRPGSVLSTITVSTNLINTYNINSHASVQVITFHMLSTAAFTSSANITCPAWSTSQGIGGVIALEVPSVFTLGHTITADGLGFIGGTVNSPEFASTSCDMTFVTAVGNKWAQKGEGIYKNTDVNLAGARGKMINGGGGGTDENSGGGGGSNYAEGADGGPGYTGSDAGCSPTNGGLGGFALTPFISNTTAARLFMGGGGGGGHENNSVGSAGARGGGIILIKTSTLTTAGTCAAIITANGGTSLDAQNDATGGGGGGGSIVMQVQKFTIASSCTLTLSANGGNGGNVGYGVSHGAGGGGGQGTIIYSVAQPTTNMTTATNNGKGGCNNNAVTPCTNTAPSPTLASGAGIKDNTSSPLPVELASFTVVKSEKQSILQWTTLTERKNSHFEVQKAQDGISFESIAAIPSKANGGTSSSILQYAYTDAAPLDGVNYYRLKQVDYNGDSKLSQIVAINFKQLDQNTFVVYPNPGNGDVFLQIRDFDLKNLVIDLNLRDVSGRQVSTKTISGSGGNAPVQLFQGLQKGYYILNVKTGYQDFNIKLIVN